MDWVTDHDHRPPEFPAYPGRFLLYNCSMLPIVYDCMHRYLVASLVQLYAYLCRITIVQVLLPQLYLASNSETGTNVPRQAQLTWYPGTVTRIIVLHNAFCCWHHYNCRLFNATITLHILLQVPIGYY